MARTKLTPEMAPAVLNSAQIALDKAIQKAEGALDVMRKVAKQLRSTAKTYGDWVPPAKPQ